MNIYIFIYKNTSNIKYSDIKKNGFVFLAIKDDRYEYNSLGLFYEQKFTKNNHLLLNDNISEAAIKYYIFNWKYYNIIIIYNICDIVKYSFYVQMFEYDYLWWNW